MSLFIEIIEGQTVMQTDTYRPITNADKEQEKNSYINLTNNNV